MKKVILTEVWGDVTRIVADDLRSHGVEVLEMTPATQDEAFIHRLQKMVSQTGADAVLPIFKPEWLAMHKHELPSAVLVPVADAATILRLDNKVSACALADGLGIEQPRIHSDYDAIGSFPVVFKRSSGLSGSGVYFPKTREALNNLVAKSRPGEFLVMDYVDGEDWSVDALRWGDFFYAAAYKVLEKRGKGMSCHRVSVDAPELVETARRILEHADYQGVCGVDFRVTPSGKALFLECNPRFSGGLESAIRSGFDIPWLLCRLAAGERISPADITFTPGVETR